MARSSRADRRHAAGALIFTLVWTSSPLLSQDCNLNGLRDSTDIASGASEDCNANGIPDVCDFVPLVFADLGIRLASHAEPQAVTTADFDGDGLSDIAVGSSGDAEDTASTLAIFFSRGSGEFEPALVLETTSLLALESADLDADGDLDLVTANGDTLRLYPNGAGGEGDRFGPFFEVPTPPASARLFVADINLDARPDLITLNPTEGNVGWFANMGEGPLGEGFFGAVRSVEVPALAVPGSSVRSLAVADFDGDGDPDLAHAETREEPVAVLANTDGNLALVHSVPSIDGAMKGLTAADLDGDGRAELVGVTRRRSLLFWRSLGEEGFGEPSKLKLSADSLSFTDVDGDGALDLFSAGPDSGGPTARLLLGGGDGTFLAPQVFRTDRPVLARADDFDGDGDGDFVFVGADEANLLFQGEGEPLVFDSTSFNAIGPPHDLDLGNFNGDGIPDVVTANGDGRTYSIFFGRDDGLLNFQGATAYDGSLRFVVVVDLNDDGADDLVSSAPNFSVGNDRRASFLVPLLNDGNGKFVAGPEIQRHVSFLGKADVDGDGRVDVVELGLGTPAGGETPVAIRLNDGSGGLTEPVLLDVDAGAMAAGDLDSDGDLDFVVTRGVTSQLSFLLQNEPEDGQIRFAPAVTVAVDGGPGDVDLADLDRDGDLDVITGNGGSEDVAIFLNPGDGRIQSVTHRFPIEPGQSSVPGRGQSGTFNLADLSGDGFLDVVAANALGLSVLRGRGDGTFSREERLRIQLRAPGRPNDVDMDADGDLDLVFRSREGSGVWVLLNQNTATVPPEEFLRTICTPVDFELLSVSDSTAFLGAGLAERRTSFLLPAREDETLLETLFINVARFALEPDFLREVFPERFGELNESDFAKIALTRASREYFTGAVRRLRLEDGSVTYGFDVRTDAADPGELLSLEETRAVFERLSASFTLEPLVYLPTTLEAREAARAWEAPGFPLIITEEAPPEPVGNPTFVLEIPAGTVLCGVFAEAGIRRGPREEYDLKTRVRLWEGSVLLPTENETFGAELIEEVVFGQERAVAEPQEAGTFRVVRIPGEVTVYRFTYRQPYTLPDGRLLELEVASPLVFRARGDEPLEESQSLTEDFFVALKGREPLGAALDGAPLVKYGSCTYDSLPLWGIEAELEDGTRLRLEERFEEAESLFETAPASVVRAEVSLASEDGERVVTDYFHLVYSASRHNRLVNYWIILDPPVALRDGGGAVHAVELRAPEESLDRPQPQAAYLGADFEVLAEPQVTRFERARLGEALFVRGDAAGDGGLDVLDAITMLEYLFGRRDAPCLKAADANDDGRLNIADPIAVVSQLFGMDAQLPAPFPNCGSDPTEDSLSCRRAPSCP